MKRALLLVLAFVLLLTATAWGGYPRPDDPRIVVPKSLGGVKLGMGRETAIRAWGGASAGDCNRSGCDYGSIIARKGYAVINFTDARVRSAAIVAGVAGKPRPGFQPPYTFEGPLMRFKTKEGIGLGVRLGRVKAAYPAARKRNRFGFVEYRIPIGTDTVMSFKADREASPRRIVQVSIGPKTVGPEN